MRRKFRCQASGVPVRISNCRPRGYGGEGRVCPRVPHERVVSRGLGSAFRCYKAPLSGYAFG